MVSSMSRSEWLKTMGRKESRLRALREARARGPQAVEEIPREKPAATERAAPAAPPEDQSRLVPRGRPRKGMKEKTIKATEPWKGKGMSRRTWFRKRKLIDT
jgi:hypothetical protein